jgi:hypothetical protein
MEGLFGESKDGGVSGISFDSPLGNGNFRVAFEFSAIAESRDECELRKRRRGFRGNRKLRYEGFFRGIICI